MKVWKLCNNFEYQSIGEKEYGEIDSWNFDGRSLKDGWQVVKFVRVKREKGAKTEFGDTASWIPGIPVFKNTTIDIVIDLIKDNVEILPIKVLDLDYSIINVTKVLDCMDYEKSIPWTVAPDGTPLGFTQYAFIFEKVKNEHIFKSTDCPRSEVYVSDEFKKRVEEHNLTNFEFKLLWDSEE